MKHYLRTAIAIASLCACLGGLPSPGWAQDSATGGQWEYNTDYLFAFTREVRDHTDKPAVVALLAPLTMLTDIAALPFEVTLGLLGRRSYPEN